MDTKTENELIEYFINEKRNGMDYSKINEILTSKNIDKNIIKSIIQKIDNQILNDEKLIIKKLRAKELIFVGFFIAITGLFITIGTYTGIINMGNSFLLMYGPILAGIGIISSSWRNYRKIK